jgi:hypothetical protein
MRRHHKNFNFCFALPENMRPQHTSSMSRVPFNFSKLLETLAQIFQTYHTYIDKWPEPFRTQVDEVADISKSCLADKLNDFNNILAALPEYVVVSRDKRFLDLISFGMSAAALTIATFNTARISKLETQIAHATNIYITWSTLQHCTNNTLKLSTKN